MEKASEKVKDRVMLISDTIHEGMMATGIGVPASNLSAKALRVLAEKLEKDVADEVVGTEREDEE